MGARKRFKDQKKEELAPELSGIWQKEIQQLKKQYVEWAASDAEGALKFKILLDGLEIKMPQVIESLLQ